jgi:hypothetical protein
MEGNFSVEPTPNNSLLHPDFVQELPFPARECWFSNLEAFPASISTQLLAGISIQNDHVLRSTSIGSFHAQELDDV